MTPKITERNSTAVEEVLFCLIPVVGWLSCLTGCNNENAGPAVTMAGPDGDEIFEGTYIDVKIGTDTAKDGSNIETKDAGKEDTTGAVETIETQVAEPKPDIAVETDGPSDTEVSPDEDTQTTELPSYDTPIGAEETWQSKYESLGLCYNEFSSCKVVTGSLCWFINQMNGDKPDTLALLDPELVSLNLELEGGPLDELGIYEFIRVDNGVVMDNGFFDSTIWMAGDILLAADFIGETVDILLIKPGFDPETGSCEYAYNYPCPGDDVCN